MKTPKEQVKIQILQKKHCFTYFNTLQSAYSLSVYCLLYFIHLARETTPANEE
jgi:hypothetical protein